MVIADETGYYFGAVGLSRLLFLSGALTLYAAFLGVIPYWLRWMAENKGDHMWFFTSIYFALALGAFLSLVTAVATVFLVIAPRHDLVRAGLITPSEANLNKKPLRLSTIGALFFLLDLQQNSY